MLQWGGAMAEAQVGVRKLEGIKFLVSVTVHEQAVAGNYSHFRRLQQHVTLYSVSKNYVTVNG
jgi:hypothetical protein